MLMTMGMMLVNMILYLLRLIVKIAFGVLRFMPMLGLVILIYTSFILSDLGNPGNRLDVVSFMVGMSYEGPVRTGLKMRGMMNPNESDIYHVIANVCNFKMYGDGLLLMGSIYYAWLGGFYILAPLILTVSEIGITYISLIGYTLVLFDSAY